MDLKLEVALLLDEVAMAINIKDDGKFECVDEMIDRFGNNMEEMVEYLSDKYSVPIL